MKMNLFFGMSLILASTGVQAATCRGDCKITYSDVVGRLSRNASYDQIKDFKINCTQYYGGSVSESYPTWDLICEKKGEQQTIATGQGFDFFQARTAARNHCSQQASSSGHSQAYGRIYGDMNCY